MGHVTESLDSHLPGPFGWSTDWRDPDWLLAPRAATVGPWRSSDEHR